MSKLFDTFTYKSNLMQRWKNYGLRPEWDADAQTLSFAFPEGWTDTMSDETRSRTLTDWCIDEPTYNVKYNLEIDGMLCNVRIKERDNDNLEFIANMKTLVNVSEKDSVCLKFTAHACEKTLSLFEGVVDLKQKLLQLGDDNAAGYVLNVGHGFALFVHFADSNQISSIVFLGKLENIAN